MTQTPEGLSFLAIAIAFTGLVVVVSKARHSQIEVQYFKRYSSRVASKSLKTSRLWLLKEEEYGDTHDCVSCFARSHHKER
ncbi:hypothetical protein [Brasilonema bromeliae]|uniref:hypothetical protein n=1 Tax=Brasilonema bromeliae TaxID=383615 RepID=UPI00145E64DC|nr:hypothetical protein [Brasilonema bromeliae]